jgi:hypothetical protein
MRELLFAGLAMGTVALSAMAALGGTVVAARSAPLDSSITIDDLVLTVVLDQTASGTLKSIYGQDATGGIAVFGSNANVDAILAGPDTIPGNGDDLGPGSRIDLTGAGFVVLLGRSSKRS